MSRATVIAFVLVATLGLAGLLVAARNDQRNTSFSLDVPDSGPVVSLEPGQSACESPVQTQAPFAGITAWLVPAAAPGAAFDVTVRDARSGRLLARGRFASGYATTTARNATLSATVPRGLRVAVCLRSAGPTRAGLLGSAPSVTTAVMTVHGKPVGASLALVFLRAHPRSLLSLLPTVFARAALFRPGWVGVWTFWVLGVAVLGAFGLAALALVQAVRADSARGERTSAE